MTPALISPLYALRDGRLEPDSVGLRFATVVPLIGVHIEPSSSCSHDRDDKCQPVGLGYAEIQADGQTDDGGYAIPKT